MVEGRGRPVKQETARECAPGDPRDNGGDSAGGKNMIQKISIAGGEGSWKPASFGEAAGAFGGSPACGLIGIEAVLLLGLLRRRRRELR